MSAYVVIIAPAMLPSSEISWNDCRPLYAKALSVLLGMKVTLILQEVPSSESIGAEFMVKTVGLDLEVALSLVAYMAALALSSHVEGLPVWKTTRLMHAMTSHDPRLHLGTSQCLHALAKIASEKSRPCR